MDRLRNPVMRMMTAISAILVRAVSIYREMSRRVVCRMISSKLRKQNMATMLLTSDAPSQRQANGPW